MAAYTTIDNPEAYFKAVLYTGNNTAIGSGGKTVTGVGFQSDFTWIKSRSSTAPNTAMDAVRGSLRTVYVNSTSADQEVAENISTWNSDGWVMGSNGDINAVQNYVGWNWKAGTTSGISGGSITPTAYSINTTSTFGIYKYDGNGTDGATIAHGLGAAPQMVIIKSTSHTTDWEVGHHMLNSGTNPWQYQMFFNTTAAQRDDTGFSDTAPSSTLVTLGNVTNINNSGKTYVMYAFSEVQGFSKFGTHTGNGNADGVFVYTGFRPAFLITKNTGATSDWPIFDNKRNAFNPMNNFVYSNSTAAEDPVIKIDFCANGYKLVSSATPNNSGHNFIYMAFAEAPFVNSKGVPCNAR